MDELSRDVPVRRIFVARMPSTARASEEATKDEPHEGQKEKIEDSRNHSEFLWSRESLR
jgi:hypothetical protein